MKTNKEEKPEALLSESENAELALINRYTRKPLAKEDVYVFSVNLCDNDVDRDFECFSLSALNGLAVLFARYVDRIKVVQHILDSCNVLYICIMVS